MKHIDCRDDGIAERDDDIVELGVASVETKGPVQIAELETFSFYPDSGIAKD